jgi:hypothetical protein
MKKIGYVVMNDREEFLQHRAVIDGATMCVWGKNPEKAMIYKNRNHAGKVAKNSLDDKRQWVLQIAENSKQFLVIADIRNAPPWFFR